jgi:hypothetical protein
MPIAPQLRPFYGREWQEVIRPRILSRAQDACECCGAPDGLFVLVGTYGAWYDRAWERWRSPGSELVDLRPPHDRGIFVEAPPFFSIRRVQIQIGIAHINHVPGDDRDDNLAALCRRCHLLHDIGQHKATRSDRKDSGRPLLAALRVKQ